LYNNSHLWTFETENQKLVGVSFNNCIDVVVDVMDTDDDDKLFTAIMLMIFF